MAQPCRCVGGAMLRPDARRPPLPHQPLRRARSTQAVCGSSLGASDPAPLLGAPSGAPRRCAPGWLPTQPRLLDAAAPGGSRGYRLRGGAAAAAPRHGRARPPPRGRAHGTAAAAPRPASAPMHSTLVENAVRGFSNSRVHSQRILTKTQNKVFEGNQVPVNDQQAKILNNGTTTNTCSNKHTSFKILSTPRLA